ASPQSSPTPPKDTALSPRQKPQKDSLPRGKASSMRPKKLSPPNTPAPPHPCTSSVFHAPRKPPPARLPGPSRPAARRSTTPPKHGVQPDPWTSYWHAGPTANETSWPCSGSSFATPTTPP